MPVNDERCRALRGGDPAWRCGPPRTGRSSRNGPPAKTGSSSARPPVRGPRARGRHDARARRCTRARLRAGGAPQTVREDWLKSLRCEPASTCPQHIRFADFWYSANGQFSDLREQCVRIADESGLKLTPEAAWRWLAQGGFANDFVDKANFGTFDLSSMKHVMGFVMGQQLEWKLSDVNVVKLNLRNAEKITLPKFENGAIQSIDCYERAGRRLPVTGIYQTLIDILQQTSDLQEVMDLLRKRYGRSAGAVGNFNVAVQTLEAMLEETWVTRKLNNNKNRVTVRTQEETDYLHFNRDPEVA